MGAQGAAELADLASSPRRTPAPGLTAGEWAFVLGAVALVYGFHCLYGALATGASMLMVAAWAALVIFALAVRPVLSDFGSIAGLTLPAALMAAVVVAVACSMSRGFPVEIKPAWAVVGQPGVATLDTSATLVEMVKLLGLSCAFLVGAMIGMDDARSRLALQALVYVAAPFALFALAIFAFHLAPQTERGRAEALFLNPNTAGTLFGSLLVLSTALLSRVLRHRRDRGGWISVAGATGCCAIVAVALINTVSRGAILATAIALLIFAAVEFRSRLRRPGQLVLAVAGVATVALLGFGLDQRLLGRFGTLGADASLRSRIFEVHWRAFLASPLLGYGLGNFDILNKSLLRPDTFADLWNIRAAENVYLQWLVEGGLAAAAPMFACVAAIIGGTFSSGLQRRSMRGWITALLAVDVVFIVHGYSDFALQTPSIAAFWAFLLGLQFTLSRSKRRN